MEKNNSDVNAFWNKFRKVVVEQGVDEKYADRYVEWGNFGSKKSVISNQKPVTKSHMLLYLFLIL